MGVSVCSASGMGLRGGRSCTTAGRPVLKVGSALPESAFHTHRRFATTRTDPSCARTLGSSLAFRPLRRMTRPSKEGPTFVPRWLWQFVPLHQVMDPERLRHSRPARLAAPRAGLLCRPLLPDVLLHLVVDPERLHPPRPARLAARRAERPCHLRRAVAPERLHQPRCSAARWAALPSSASGRPPSPGSGPRTPPPASARSSCSAAR